MEARIEAPGNVGNESPRQTAAWGQNKIQSHAAVCQAFL